jgi:hypothetical protein
MVVTFIQVVRAYSALSTNSSLEGEPVAANKWKESNVAQQRDQQCILKQSRKN